MAKWKCSECGAVLDGRGKSGHAALKSHEGKEVTYTKVEAENDGNNNGVVAVGDNGIQDNDISNVPDNRDTVNDIRINGVVGVDGSNATKNEENSIQIIDSHTGKKEKGIVDQIFEKLFSDDIAPITTSILASLATRLQQPNNATGEGILTAEDGSKHQMI